MSDQPYKICIMSDSHAGSCHGLTVPDEEGSWHGARRWHKWQRIMSEWFFAETAKFGPYDLVLHNAEMLDGPGRKSTLEMWSTDIEEQAEDAARVLLSIPCDRYRLTYGSGYHSRGHARYEHQVVRMLKAAGRDVSIANHQRFEVYGVKFDAHHKVGASRTAYAQGTQLAKGGIIDWLRQWIRREEPADVYIRSHNHYHYFVGNHRYQVHQTPCLELPFGEMSVETDSALYDVGYLHGEVWPNGHVEIVPRIMECDWPESKYEVLARAGRDNGGKRKKR